MPIISSISAGARAFGLYVLTALASVIDTFNRPNNTSDLGSISGQKWKVWRGVWGIATNKASTSTAASSIPLATLTFTNADVQISAVTNAPGTGVTFWLSDADNWWSATYDEVYACQTCYAFVCSGGYNTAVYTYTQSCPSCGCQTYGNTCVANGTCSGYSPAYSYSYTTTCSAWVPGYCAYRKPGYGTCAVWQPGYTYYYFCPATAYVAAYYYTYSCCTAYNCATCANCAVVSYYVCSSGYSYSYSCNCATSYYMRIWKSIAGTVTEVANSLFSATVQSFKTILSGSNITIKTYSDTSYTSQIGSDWNTSSTGAIKNKKHGIIVMSANYNQGSTIDEFKVQ